jgi:uncharacterized protein YcaQ
MVRGSEGDPSARPRAAGHLCHSVGDGAAADPPAPAVSGVTTLADLRRFAVSRSLFAPATLVRAIDVLGFVQADPIRAPARAQDLTLRLRVDGYRAGDLDRLYPALGVEEDVFINYGFVTHRLQALMHPRSQASLRPTARNRRAAAVLAFVREHGAVHPREVDAHFSHGRVTNYWGGSSNATTHLLEAMHYKGMLRVVRRDGGIRIYAPHEHGAGPSGPAARRSRVDALVDLAVNLYAPMPSASLSYVVGRLRYAVPQWRGELKSALARARQRLAHARVDRVDWYWPAGEPLASEPPAEMARLLAPFDPVVWDRRRFELLWGWPYRFEAYTPLAKRQFGYYALPLLWRDRVIGWGNVTVRQGRVHAALGYVDARAPRQPSFIRELEAELERMRWFLGAESTATTPAPA